MPNTQDCSKQPWSSYRISVDVIEHAYRIRFPFKRTCGYSESSGGKNG